MTTDFYSTQEFWGPLFMAAFGALFVWKSAYEWDAGVVTMKGRGTHRAESPVLFFIIWLIQMTFAIFWISLATYFFCRHLAEMI